MTLTQEQMLLEHALRHHTVACMGGGEPGLPTLIEIQSFKELIESLNAKKNLCAVCFWLAGHLAEPLGFVLLEYIV